MLSELDLRGVAITALGSQYDFITRFFAPKYGINEDPVTGSAFTQLIPYWSKKQVKRNVCKASIHSRRGSKLHLFK
ncbi:PhzF family phenazine biosynthesis protein [sulfur-oxidizing endosymbiont of Gigantopelta aegis]|uniref:PhzF family phenazine biosynthesis protein n=1 Tax=sulfur-oxidizing endosymbiont of Gigantopelta aegis TaxID=2794934 RepID=UPI003CCCC0DA